MSDAVPSVSVEQPILAKESLFAVCYFAAYIAYLCWRLENEFLHWGSLVLLPLGLIFLHRTIKGAPSPFAESLGSVGLRRGNLATGLLTAGLVGLLLSLLQIFLSRDRGKILELIQSGKAFWLFPVVFAVMLLTAGFTEEFFFRGVLQTRLAALIRSNFWAVIVVALLFGLYHLPYAYLNPRWPSHGNWPHAIKLAFGQGVPAGIILGWIYVRSKSNLVACVVTHALINSLPGMLHIKFG